MVIKLGGGMGFPAEQPLASPSPAFIYGYGGQPTAQAGLATKISQFFIGGQKHILHHIFRFIRPAEQPIGQFRHPLLMTLYDMVKGR